MVAKTSFELLSFCALVDRSGSSLPSVPTMTAASAAASADVASLSSSSLLWPAPPGGSLEASPLSPGTAKALPFVRVVVVAVAVAAVSLML